MRAVPGKPPFASYAGAEAYIFVSYAHRDSSDVYAEIAWLNERGFNIWYDEGIHAGEHWNDELARAIRRADVFLFLITPNSVRSSHCLRELNFAIATERPILAVHLEPTELPDGVQFSTGDRQAILRSRYAEHRYREKLSEALRAILDGEHRAASVGRAVVSGNLPTDTEPLIGRDRDVSALCERLISQRLTTLTGSGGAGKTRLALAAAHATQSEFRDGGWLLPLASLNSGELIAQQLARVLQITDIAGTAPMTSIVDFLRSREVLLVFDNCEHLIDDVAALCATLLADCPQVSILATSREPLHVGGEHLLQVQPLATAVDADGQPPAAAVLFAARAAAVRAGFELDAQTLPAVLRICERVDGIPLAIELAAARCSAMSVQDMADRLAASFKALGRGRRDTVAHHQTLQATLDWSYRLLADDEQALLRQLSVFSGAFDLTAAEQVCAGDEVDADDIIDLVERLVDKSLVTADTSATTTRFRLLESVRDFANNKLDDHANLRARHRDYFVGLAERAAMAIQIEPARWVAELDPVQDNLRAALQWSLDRGDGDAALRMVGALSYFWVLNGSAAEKRTWFERALEHVDGVSTQTRARALLGAGMAAGLDADYASSAARLDAAQQAFETLEQPGGVAWTRFWQGRNETARVWSGCADASLLASAEQHYQAALGWFLPNEDGFGIIISLAFSAWAAQLGMRDDAMPRIDQAIAAARKAGIERGEMVSRAHKANLMASQGDVRPALAELDRCIDGLTRLGDQLNSRICLSLAGLIGLASGQPEYALAKARDAVAPDSRLRTREWEPPRIGLAAFVLAAYDEHQAAARLYAVLDNMLPSWRTCLSSCGLADADERYQSSIAHVADAVNTDITEAAQRMTVSDAILFARQALRQVNENY